MRWERPPGVPIVWSPYRIPPIHWLMAQMLPSTFLFLILILVNASFAPQNSLPSRSSHISPFVASFLARFRSFSLGISFRLHFCDCSSGIQFSSRWSAIEYHRCQLPCSCFITNDDPQRKRVHFMGFYHARKAVYSISECKFCENFLLKTLRTRLAVFERKSSVFPHRVPEAAEAFRESQSSKLDEPFLTLGSGGGEFYLTRQGKTFWTFLPASYTLSSLTSVTSAQRVSVCSKRPSSISFRGVVGRYIRLPSPTTCSFVTRGSCYRRHVRFSPTAYRPCTGRFSVEYISPCELPHP